MGTLAQDLRFALRTLRRRWMVTGLAVLSLALAIGGNASVFSMVDAFLFRPLPYPEPERVVLIGERQKDQPEFSSGLGTSLPTFADFSERSRLIAEWGALQPTTLSLRGADAAEPISAVRATGGFFDVLRVSPVRGRLFMAGELVEGGPRVVVLGYDFWIERYGEGRDPLGEVLTLGGEPHEVVGVLPQGFEFLTPGQDLWVPLARSPTSAARDQRTVLAIGRIRDGAAMEAVRAEATAIAADLETEFADTQRDWTVDAFNLRYDIPSRQSRILFGLLQGSVLLVLLIACVNVTNLLIARGQERSREIALRTVLGAGRGRIVRQLLTESSLMVLAGALGGLVLAVFGIRAMAAQFVGVLPANWAIQLDARVVLFTAAISVGAGLFFGLAPALQTFRHGQGDALREGPRSGRGRSRKTFSRVLVVGEIALSFVALGGGSLLVRSFLALQSADPGFDAGPVLTASVQVPSSRYPDDDSRVLLADRILEQAGAVEGVEAAALAGTLPQAPLAVSDSFRVADRAPDPARPAPRAVVVRASPRYADVLGVGLVRGRFLSAEDRIDAAPVAVISQALADEWFPEESPLGRRIELRGQSREIVGVVAEIQQVLLQTGSGTSGLTIYIPIAQQPEGGTFLLVRTRVEPGTVAEPIRSAVQAIDPDMTLAQLLTMEEYVEQFFVGVQIFNVVLGGFGLVALLLASLGTYGVLAYSVSRRGHEIGIRMAVGAQGGQVVRMFTRQGVWLGVIGLGVGVLLTLPLVGVLRSALQGISTVQPSTLALIAGVLFAVTLLASYVPANRAATVDPMKTLRDE